MIDLQKIAFRIALGQVDAEEIQSTIDSLLNEGVYSDDFIDIIDSKPARLADVLPPFRSYMESQGISVPTKEDGVCQSIGYHVSRIVSGDVDPLDELQVLISEVYWTYDFHSVSKEYLGDSHGIHHLIGLYWGYDDLKERPREVSCNGKYGEAGIKELKKEIVKSAKEWMERYANKAYKRTRK